MTIEEVESLLASTNDPKVIFGSSDPKKTFRSLISVVHPDHNDNNPLSVRLFKEINRLWDVKDAPLPTIKSPKRTYTIGKLIASGDVADIYHAEGASTSTIGMMPLTNKYVLKISRIVNGHTLLDNEQKILTKFSLDARASAYSLLLPKLAESFLAKDKIQKRVNVFVFEDGLYSVDEVLKAHPIIDPRHLVWLFKRILMIIGFAHKHGIVHSAVLPEHVRIVPVNHGLQLIGWGHAVDTGGVVKTISAKYRAWYPPEVLKKQTVSAATDIFMAAKTMIYLAGGDPISNRMPDSVPSNMQRFLKSCTLEGQNMRPDNAWTLHDEFSDLAKLLYGPPKFVNLEM